MTTVNLVTDSLRSYEPRDLWSIKVRRRGYQRWRLIRAQIDFYYFWEKRWFFFAMAVGCAMLMMPQPDGLTREGQIVLTMSVVAVILFVTEPVPLPAITTYSPHYASATALSFVRHWTTCLKPRSPSATGNFSVSGTITSRTSIRRTGSGLSSPPRGPRNTR